jgi:7,8-dihydropterin-6-yl-methyl-4-(beta-D-ribofuranosyl)aminobenzene 5'-phosphate synthase
MSDMVRIAWSLALVVFLAAGGVAPAVPPPCSEEELLASSDYAIEGYVIGVRCGEPYDSGECAPWIPAGGGFQPELVADCTATVRVTRVLKGGRDAGGHDVGDEVEIPFLKLVQACEGGDPMVPGSPKKDFRLNSRVRYFHSTACAYSNFSELEAPFARGDTNADEQVDVSDAVSILLFLFGELGWEPPAGAMDANADETVDVADPVYLLAYLFKNGPPPPPPPFPPAEVRLSIAYDNYSVEPALQTDWGFSCLVETRNRTLLLDTGRDGTMLLGNMQRMNIVPQRIEAVFLSHIHEDHVGGLPEVLATATGIPVYIPESFPDTIREDINWHGCEFVDISTPREIGESLYSSGELAARPVEQSLFVKTGRGVVVVTGCSHPGVVFIVSEAKRQLGEEIYLVLGGFHLFQASDSELRAVITAFRDLGVEKVAPCHCSGDRTRELFREEYGADYIEVGAGARVSVWP